MAVVATRQGQPLALGRRAIARRARFVASALLTGFLGAGLLGFGVMIAGPTPAAAQSFTYNPVPRRPVPPPVPNRSDGQMLVQANEIDYDYVNSRVSAVGGVQIYYNGSSVEADKVTYDQKTKRLSAVGNIRMTDSEGRITYANSIDLSDDYRDGFVDSLRVDTPDQTRMAASRADRTAGRFTVYENGVYTACQACKTDPKKPPLWQVKGARIIHDQGEKMMYFEDARLEFFGVPLAYIPYFSTPDPTVKRKSGFLMPGITSNSSSYGFGVEVPYYFALDPSYDLTISPRFTTGQGVLMQGEFRQRLLDGAYSIRGYGIFQTDPGKFAGSDGDRDFRGGLESKGQFAINDKWVWGWNGVLLTDKYFLLNYNLSMYRDIVSSFLSTYTDALSQIYLTGVGNRSFFDARTMYWQGFSGADVQGQLPWVRPIIDYNKTLNYPVFGGEFSYKTNFVSLHRDQVAYDPITTTANTSGWCLPTSADPLVKTPTNCLLRGIAGDYTRLSGEVNWRRSFTDPLGQIWTPFASLRGDVISTQINDQTGVSNFVQPGQMDVGRVMPAIGFEYRYPFINVQPWGTTIIEPMAQVIVRPNETYAARLPNEDAQSLVFDDSNLFSVNKFSGWDRVEGGGRANVGIKGTVQFDRGGTINALFGQSYQLYGLNSYSVAGFTNTGIGSGLDTTASDYVARISYQPNSTYTFTSRARFDQATGDVRRFETEARATFDRWSVSVLYGNYDKQPEIGYLYRRQGILANGSIKLASNWVLTGGARYDLEANTINQYIVGAGYVDDCFVLALNYVTDYTYTTGSTVPTLSHRVMFQIGLRTIATTSQGVGGTGGVLQ